MDDWKVRLGLILPLLLTFLLTGSARRVDGVEFVRGDVSGDASVDLLDAVLLLNHLFLGQPVACQDALDVEDGGGIHLGDAVLLLGYLFQGGASPALPFPACGPDPTLDTLDCVGPVQGCAGGSGPGFGYPGPSSLTGDDPVFLAPTEVDGDGKLDLIVAGLGSPGSMKVMIGNGDGTFLTASEIPINTSVTHMVLGDLDLDQDLDVVIQGFPASFDVLMNHGNGTFVQLPTIALGISSSFDLGDVNSDGYLDLLALISNVSGHSLTILTGVGDGTFVTSSVVPVSPAPSAVRLADLDGDTDLDVVIGIQGVGSIRMYLGDGLGNIVPFGDFPAGGPVDFIHMRDLDGDNHLDLLTTSSSVSDLRVLLGTGGGPLAPSRHTRPGSGPGTSTSRI